MYPCINAKSFIEKKKKKKKKKKLRFVPLREEGEHSVMKHSSAWSFTMRKLPPIIYCACVLGRSAIPQECDISPCDHDHYTKVYTKYTEYGNTDKQGLDELSLKKLST